ncbi:uncharacterized protein TRIADDRAFT_59783 [Trichoplax adhaerens]|uniref:Uncharacterized protein n=1 Tax=Trichoplax adhaerens TaxID=10228 RepID=B3S6F1_TRIAD|nr:predicted protein [Trichoplax adhaerens]EDV21610.1 predicted protein [Trichoplax adhaerens]|eukprot:XP_002115758.1 predicted protein [Trichoplax adhaerens]
MEERKLRSRKRKTRSNLSENDKEKELLPGLRSELFDSPNKLNTPANIKFSSTLDESNNLVLEDSCFGFNFLESELESLPTSPTKSVSSVTSSMYSMNDNCKPAHRRASRSYSRIPLQEIDNEQPSKKKSKKSKKAKLEDERDRKDWIESVTSEFDMIGSHELKIV